ncbi:MAG TPA: protein translocase subunit SecF [Persephonella sp.]|uniref:Protein-export membrane protein SecF n=1 Tax=Persephonella marina (strain DSM 14350 / EX-H1) TaxID=123214 RepID=C0QRM5_PERMH|nr:MULTISPECIES: protein translocase subunit SecF [Persephonella]ACO04229.1 protein-export membrane protein SecF [Persephonella marina EX-H1]HCB69067.1 protein translocase subunit SecF [Persephonella sp.]
MRNFLNEPPNIDFLKIKKQGYIFSILLVLLSLGVIFTKGFNFGLDFTGGTSIQVRFSEPVNTGDVRNALRIVNLQDSVIQEIGTDKREYEIRVSLKKGKSAEIYAKVKKALDEKFKDKYEIRKMDYIGAVVGEELRKASVYSIVAVLVAILIYVSYRFEPVFSLGAVIPLFHDAIITLGIFALFGIEVNLAVIAAILTVLGYSLNDTIIIFDRIRENIKIRGKKNLQLLVNQSINENLARTIITSGTTLFSVLALYLFGGESLKGFALALLIGIVFGTYSSIYVASPIIVDLERFLRKKTSGSKAEKEKAPQV